MNINYESIGNNLSENMNFSRVQNILAGRLAGWLCNAWNEKEHKKAQSIWKELKDKAKEDPDLIDKQINDYKIKASEKESRKLKLWKGFTSATSSSSRLDKKV